MRRFYKDATAQATDGGYTIRLDGRPVRTPARAEVLVPASVLAEAVAAEWNAQGEKIDPRAMPLTGLANAAIDRVAPHPEGFALGLAAYGESDLLYYRSEGPDALRRRQDAAWDPVLDWARARFDIDFEIVTGIIHRAQPPRTVEQLGKAVVSRNPYELAAFSPLVTISGSLILALALAERAIDLDAAWAAATLDEAWQAEQWGADADAAAALEAKRREFAAGHRFLTLLE